MHLGDLDLRSRTLKVERAVSLGLQKIKKTEGSTRKVDLSDGLVSLLAAYVEYVKAEAVAVSAPEPYWLFPGREGGLATEADERWHRKLFKHVLQAAKLPEFHPKDLRHTFASMLLSQNVPLVYVSNQLGHSKPTTTLKHYADYCPTGDQRLVNVLDMQLEKVGTKTWHQVDMIEGEDSEVVGKFGGPCRGRTYGPLIKSETWGIAQVVDDMGNPLVLCGDSHLYCSSVFASLCPLSA